MLQYVDRNILAQSQCQEQDASKRIVVATPLLKTGDISLPTDALPITATKTNIYYLQRHMRVSPEVALEAGHGVFRKTREELSIKRLMHIRKAVKKMKYFEALL